MVILLIEKVRIMFLVPGQSFNKGVIYLHNIEIYVYKNIYSTI